VGTFGSGQDQFVIPHSIAADSHDNIYLAERDLQGIGDPHQECVAKLTVAQPFRAAGRRGQA
jgi:hypothetical protein